MADSVLADLFRNGGSEEAVKAGTVIYAESRRIKVADGTDAAKQQRMYYLLSGEVTLTRNGKPLAMVLPGEVLGSTALLSGVTRMATATARKDSVLLSLTKQQLTSALGKQPEFALTLIESMGQRLNSSFQRATKQGLSFPDPLLNTGTLPAGALTDISHALGDPVPMRADVGGTIITKDGIGLYMYVLIEGKVAIAVNDQVVEHVGPEAVFGELAMIGGANRSATATAIEPCKWYALGRNDFLQLVQSKPELGIDILRSLSDRVRRAGFLLSEPPSVLRALNAPRLNAAAAGKVLGAIRMFYNRAAQSFMDDAVPLLKKLAEVLSANDRSGSLATVKKLHAMAVRIGAERFAFQLEVLENLLGDDSQNSTPISAQPTLVEQLQALRAEFQDTCDEIVEYLKKT